MDKQRPVNKVAHNDAYSSTLMEMYANWMGGDCFQGSNIPEAFAGMEPQSHGAEVEDTTKKKKKIDKKEKSVAEGIRCPKCGGNHAAEDCPGPQREILEREEYEIDGVTYVIEKQKGLDGKACWKGYKLAGTKKKGGKTVDNCVKEGKKLDPVGKEDADIDNDGDVDKSDKYLHARRKKIGKILAMNKKSK